MTKPPCYTEGRGDCPDRKVLCHNTCDKYKEWLEIREAEKEKIQRNRAQGIEADTFLIGQKLRVKLSMHRDYMRNYRKV